MDSKLNHSVNPLCFDTPGLFVALQESSSEHLDSLDFGVIGFDEAGIVCRYNATESRLAGLSASTVMGYHFFEVVAPCMNNFMVAEQFSDALAAKTSMDCVLDYVLTLRMRPQRVKLRLLAMQDAAMRYVIVQRNL